MNHACGHEGHFVITVRTLNPYRTAVSSSIGNNVGNSVVAFLMLSQQRGLTQRVKCGMQLGREDAFYPGPYRPIRCALIWFVSLCVGRPATSLIEVAQLLLSLILHTGYFVVDRKRLV